jgi:hypothetical protein
VGQDTGQLVLVLEAGKQAGVHVDGARGIGERVQRGVFQDLDAGPDDLLLGHARRRQVSGQLVEVVPEQRILVETSVVVELPLLGAGLLPQRLLVAEGLVTGAEVLDGGDGFRTGAGCEEGESGEDRHGATQLWLSHGIGPPVASGVPRPESFGESTLPGWLHQVPTPMARSLQSWSDAGPPGTHTRAGMDSRRLYRTRAAPDAARRVRRVSPPFTTSVCFSYGMTDEGRS